MITLLLESTHTQICQVAKFGYFVGNFNAILDIINNSLRQGWSLRHDLYLMQPKQIL